MVAPAKTTLLMSIGFLTVRSAEVLAFAFGLTPPLAGACGC